MYYLHPAKALLSSATDVRYVKSLVAELLGGGPVVFGRGDEPILALSGFFPEDAPAANLLALLVYRWRRGLLDLPPVAAAPVVDVEALRGGAAAVYYDFLELRSEAAREVTRFYHMARPRAVVVLLGGVEFDVAATTEVAAEILSVRRVTPDVHTPEGVATLKYSHGVVVKVPPRHFQRFERRVAELVRKAAALPAVERPRVKVPRREIYLLHGGAPLEDGVELDNEVYVYI
ncbi:MAG: hypothetical protein ACK4SY_05665 [Pyrobaculum sp.]